ncbi:MAG: hypothetical protein ACKVE4_02810 [Dissulfuribacterales bacterium]
MATFQKSGPLFTDLYELTMAAAYFDHNVTDNAAFSLFVRNYPKNRNYFVAAGLADALNELADFTFSDQDIDYLKSTGLFKNNFLSYLKDFKFTSNVLAGKLYGIPVSGTMAHSYVTAFDNEVQAFEKYAQTYPDNSVFLIDTYDTIKGAKNAVIVAQAMAKKGNALIGVRLDSGDMDELSKQVRQILDDAGPPEVKIFASSEFDEYKITDIIKKGACIDAFGVGTKMGVSADAPYLDIVYKMVRFKDQDIRKLSPGKINLPGEKQMFRKTDNNGKFSEDTIGLKNEIIADMIPIIETVMKNGRIIATPPSLDEIRNSFARNFSALDEADKIGEHTYPVTISDQLAEI